MPNPGVLHNLLGQQLCMLCGQSGGTYIWKEALMVKIETGEWPSPMDPTIHWTCNNCLLTWKGGLDCESACYGKPAQDSILFHVEAIARKLCDTPPLECQGQFQVLTLAQATSFIIGPHGRGYYGFFGDSWDITSTYTLTSVTVYMTKQLYRRTQESLKSL